MFSRDGIDIYREKNTTWRAVDKVAAGHNGELTHGASRDVFKSFRTQLFRVARQRGGNMNF